MRDLFVGGGLALVFFVVSFFLGPNGNFPLNDDWQYAHVAKHLAQTGVFKVDVPVAPTLFLQSVLGAWVSKNFGFSFEALRWLTVALAGVLLTLIYALQRFAGAQRTWAVLGVLCLLVNPLWLHLTQSFMTEIYGAVIGLFGVCLWFYSKRRLSLACLAAFIMGSAFWVRQYSVLVFPAVVGASWIGSGLGIKETFRRFLAKPLGPLGVGVSFLMPVLAYFFWSRATGNYNPSFAVPFKKTLLRPGIGHWVIQAPLLVFYVTAAVAPLWMALGVGHWGWLKAAWRRTWRWSVGVTVVLGCWGVLAWFFGDQPYGVRGTLHRFFPFLGNVLSPFGVGPVTLSDVYFGPGLGPLQFEVWPWLLIEVALVALGGLWATLGRGVFGSLPQKARELVVFAVLLGALTFLASVQAYLFAIFDRYHFQAMVAAVMCLPVLLSAVVPVPSRKAVATALLCVGAIGAWTFSAQHDYFAWNAARWKLLQRADESGVSAREIDGGYEMNGWLTFEGGRPNADDPDCGLKQLWFCPSRKFQIGVNLEPGRIEVMRQKVDSWLGHFPDLLLTERP
ncbi:MAG: ArnT family glycosyltransferase [Oligoflexia bacterium]